MTVMQQAEHVRNLATQVAFSVGRDHFARAAADEAAKRADELVRALERVLTGPEAEPFSRTDYGD